ncbi:MAG: dihydropteroate synthase [Planctomycetales bacterium]|nr:dihydropteroate synthase [Planctomycetales bacterium]
MNSFSSIKAGDHVQFITGKLAERAVQNVASRIALDVGFTFTVDVMPITVAALIQPSWLLRHLHVNSETDWLILPGYLTSQIELIASKVSVPVACGPKDIRDLPYFFSKSRDSTPILDQHNIEILAEINHANHLADNELLQLAQQARADGADIIDLGCTPGVRWINVADAVERLRDAGLRVSIDSFDQWEVNQACRAGAELVLSVNFSNRHAAADWGKEVVVIPEHPQEEKHFLETVDFLSQRSVTMRLDPILEPIGCGFTSSLKRYIECRNQFPNHKMMMGIGNLTELSDVDSAGVNLMLLGICQELSIESVLTTQVINWASSCIRECDIARRMVYHAVSQNRPPKNLSDELVMLRDRRLLTYTDDYFATLTAAIRDRNIRIFVNKGEIHLVSTGIHLHGTKPYEVMQALLDSPIGQTMDSKHAFYLGYELSKAHVAITLGKQYEQDQELQWGFLTRPEGHQRLK